MHFYSETLLAMLFSLLVAVAGSGETFALVGNLAFVWYLLIPRQ